MREIRLLRDGIAAQQGQCVSPMLIQCWANVVDGVSTLDQDEPNVLCRLVDGGPGEFPWCYLMAAYPSTSMYVTPYSADMSLYKP